MLLGGVLEHLLPFPEEVFGVNDWKLNAVFTEHLEARSSGDPVQRGGRRSSPPFHLLNSSLAMWVNQAHAVHALKDESEGM
jgi:hypothetical protein